MMMLAGLRPDGWRLHTLRTVAPDPLPVANELLLRRQANADAAWALTRRGGMDRYQAAAVIGCSPCTVDVGARRVESRR